MIRYFVAYQYGAARAVNRASTREAMGGRIWSAASTGNAGLTMALPSAQRGKGQHPAVAPDEPTGAQYPLHAPGILPVHERLVRRPVNQGQ
jgi:hypothetical protein